MAKLHIATYIQFMAKEIENLYNEKSPIQQLYVSIQKREEQLKFIQELNKFLSNVITPEVKDNVFFIKFTYPKNRQENHLRDCEF